MLKNVLFVTMSIVAVLAAAGCGRQPEQGRQAPEVSFEYRPGQLLVRVGGEEFATYVYSDPEIPRPYFAHVKTPSGIQVTRNHPPVPGKDETDHATFHPGIWLAFGDISGNDYWRLGAKVEHEMFVGDPQGGPGEGTFTVRNYYCRAADGSRMVLEVCKYTVIADEGCYILISESTFSSDQEDFYFGDQEEFGLGVRVATPISVRYGGHMVNAEGLVDEKGVWGKASDWCDYHGVVDDTLIGMTIMPDPLNFRQCWYHARDYGFIAANPFGRKAMNQGPESKVVVKKGEKFHLGFGVAVYSAPKGAEVDRNANYRRYLGRIGVK
jgi:hypothetical protein